jgi:Protein of unknown function (DUF3108)
MGKKIGLPSLVVILLLAAGAWFFYRNLHRAPVQYRDSVLLPESHPTAAPSSSTSLPETTANSVKNPAAIAAAQFEPRPGESLEFAANVPKLNSTIANIKLVVGDRQKFAGKTAWHFQAFAHTENPYRMVFELDDRFDSYSDAANSMASLQYEMHLSERGQKIDSVQRMLPSERDYAPPDATAARVLPGTRDPIGMLQFLRGVDWSKTPQVHSPVFDGHKLYDVRAWQVAKSVHVSVPAGNFNAQKIEIHVFDNGVEMKDAHFLLYLTNDSARTPVLMEAQLPVATARVELTKAK